MYMSGCIQWQTPALNHTRRSRKSVLRRLLIGAFLLALPVWGQSSQPDWQKQVRRYADKQDWAPAMRIVDEEIARAPGDMDVRAWRARILEWSGKLAEAEQEYLQILQIANKDPDNWMGLGNVYLREGKNQEAVRALDTAIGLDPKRADLRMGHGRALAAAGDLKGARLEFQRALRLDPANREVRVAQRSVFGAPKNELTVGQEDHAFNFLIQTMTNGSAFRLSGPSLEHHICWELLSVGSGPRREVSGQRRRPASKMGRADRGRSDRTR